MYFATPTSGDRDTVWSSLVGTVEYKWERLIAFLFFLYQVLIATIKLCLLKMGFVFFLLVIEFFDSMFLKVHNAKQYLHINY